MRNKILAILISLAITGVPQLGADVIAKLCTKVSNPVDSPGQGSYGSAQTVTLTDAGYGGAGLFICYTVDGSAPWYNGTSCGNGTHYTAGFSVAATSTVKYIACGTNYSCSPVQSSVYTIGGIFFDAACSGGTASATSFSFNCTPTGGSNTGLGVGLSFSTKTVTGVAVTWNGVALTQLGTNCTNGSNNEMTAIFYLANPASGTHSLSVSWTTASIAVMGGVFVTGADQTTPMNNGGCTSSAANAAPTQTVTSTSGDLTMAVVALESGSTVTGASNTERWNIRQSFTVGAAGQTGTGTGTDTLSWSIATSGYEMSGGNFKHQ